MTEAKIDCERAFMPHGQENRRSMRSFVQEIILHGLGDLFQEAINLCVHGDGLL